ncbi:hypothetical protein J3Q64DRAFT_1853513 [Phycomyces blakesleeanus]|uniref:Reverse transcriptase zinc-binding domain-containing protein n=1 Tax=Phycomyces blakesleeanus TaxID=4837 RepID=A0ABR3AIZ9_PHYBL
MFILLPLALLANDCLSLTLRWLHPILDNQVNKPFVTPWIRYLLNPNQTFWDLRLLLVFPRLRVSFLRAKTSGLSTILSAIYSLHRDFSLLTPSHPTCLSLKLLDVVIYKDPFTQDTSGWKIRMVADVFVSDYNLYDVRPRLPSERTNLTYLIEKLLHDLAKDLAELALLFWRSNLLPREHSDLLPPTRPLVIDCTPFVSALQNGHKRWSDLFSRRFWNLCRDPSSLPSLRCPLRLTRWKLLWSLPIHYTARNIWHRAIQNTLSCQVTLHHRASSIFPTSTCHMCTANNDTLTHFIYQCPHKWSVWEISWERYFGQTPLPGDVHRALFCFDLPAHSLPYVHVQSSQVVSSIILTI